MIIRLFTLFLLFGLPFLVIPFGLSQFEAPKVIATILFVAILFLAQIRHLLKGVFHLFFFLFLAGLALYHLFYPIFPDHLLWGNAWRPQGTIVYLSLFLLFLVSLKLHQNISQYTKVAFFALIALFAATLIIGPGESFRFIGTLGEPTALGATVLFIFPFTTINNSKRNRVISLILASVLVLLTGSRGVLLGFAAECIILLFLKHRLLLSLASFSFVLVYILSLAAPFMPKEQPKDLSQRFENRAEIWSISAKAGLDSPWIGTGFGSAQDAISNKAWEVKDFTRFQPIDHAHNLFLNWWLMSGLAGVTVLITLIALSVKNLIAAKSWVLLSALVGLIIVQSFNPVSIVTLVHFWWLLGTSFRLKPIV